jgi:hypothetical protein
MTMDKVRVNAADIFHVQPLSKIHMLLRDCCPIYAEVSQLVSSDYNDTGVMFLMQFSALIPSACVN